MENIDNITTKPRLDLSTTPWVECSNNSYLFENKILFKRVSPIISPTGREEYVPLEAIVCSKCGKIPKFFYEKASGMPDELKSDCTFKFS
jgi:hypothetical protein